MAFPGGVPAHRWLRDLFIIRELLLQYLLSSIFVSGVTSVYAFFNRTVEIMFDVNYGFLNYLRREIVLTLSSTFSRSSSFRSILCASPFHS